MAPASRGIALRLTPPSSADELERRRLERRREDAAERLDRVHATGGDVAAGVAALRARELDPQRDVSAETAARSSGTRRNVWSLPAHPTVSASSLVPSRLTSIRPETSDASSAFAPSSPCSSETVKSSSSGPCCDRVDRPRPPSPPRRRSRCRRRASFPRPSPSRRRRARRFALPADRTDSFGSRSQTMSRCDWRTTVGAPSRPARGRNPHDHVALGVGPRVEARAQLPRRGRARVQAPPAFDGRAMRVSSEKRSQTSAGSSPASGSPLTGAA